MQVGVAVEMPFNALEGRLVEPNQRVQNLIAFSRLGRSPLKRRQEMKGLPWPNVVT